MPRFEGAADEFGDLHDFVGMVPRKAPLDLGALVERLDGKFFHGIELYGSSRPLSNGERAFNFLAVRAETVS